MAASLSSNDDPMILAESLTMKEIITAAGEAAFTYPERRRRELLLRAVQNSDVLQAKIEEAYLRKEERASNDKAQCLKRARLHDPIEEVDSADSNSRQDTFLCPSSEDVNNNCLARFIDRTSNAGTHHVLCIVCALELPFLGTEEILVKDIPQSHLLIPTVRHSAQQLIHGMLLHNPAVQVANNVPYGRICGECLQDLRIHKLPKLSLANGLWIGNIPRELAILTLPEKVLIGLHFPVSFIVKLYPQKKGARNWDTSAMNSGLRGNVSTYRLNTDDIAAMIEGHLLPRTPNILPATIGITIIGPKNLPARNLPQFLTVNRERVRQALVFLKRENSLYHNISISDAALNLLPLDSTVPSELLSVVKHSSDTHSLDQEREGYVVEDDDEIASVDCEYCPLFIS